MGKIVIIGIGLVLAAIGGAIGSRSGEKDKSVMSSLEIHEEMNEKRRQEGKPTLTAINEKRQILEEYTGLLPAADQGKKRVRVPGKDAQHSFKSGARLFDYRTVSRSSFLLSNFACFSSAMLRSSFVMNLSQVSLISTDLDSIP